MCSLGFCLAFLLVQVVFLMHCSDQKSAEIMKDGGVSGKPEINVEEVVKKFIVKFYKKRFVDNQNLVIAPLLVFKVFSSLYDVMDASAKYDLHSLVDIPQNASKEKLLEFETFTNQSLEAGLSIRSRMETRLYYDKFVGQINSALQAKNVQAVPTNFIEKRMFLEEVNNWVRNSAIRGTDDLVRDYDVNNETKAFLAGTFSFDWPSHLRLLDGEKNFQGETVQFLERNIRTSYAKLDHHSIEIVELTRDELPAIKLWLILPNADSSINAFKEEITVDMINEIESGLAEKLTDVALTLPKVSIEYNSQEDAYVMEAFEVLSSLFTTPSIKLVEDKDGLYPVKNFLMKYILQLTPSETTIESKESDSKHLLFDRPFVLMILTKNKSMPLMLANYFSPKDKIHKLEELERKLEAQQHDGL